MGQKKPCIKCLLQDLNEREEYEKLQAYLASFPEDIKVTRAAYQSRLNLCRSCDCLYQGICVKCGCFVEARAWKKNGTCPHEVPRW